MATVATMDARLHASISELIPFVEAKITQLEERGTSAGTRRGDAGDTASANLTDLETLIVRLQQIKSWLEEGNPAFQTVLRQYITDENQRNQRRDSRRDWSIAIVTTIVGVLLGWLSSLAATPVTLWHLLIH